MTRTILLVDDSQTMRQVLKVYLMGRDYEFVEAADAARAMLLLRTMPVDLLIADINMPGADGIELTQQLRGSDIPNARRMPVVLVTGDRSEELRSRATLAGVDSFLLKPVDSAQLAETVERLLQPLSKRVEA